MDARTLSIAAGVADTRARPWLYKWVVLVLTTGLMLSDYATRAVISGVFPLIKSEWGLSDARLGALVSVIPLIVGIGSFPISLLADRWGRVKSVTAMAALWCVATLACGFSQSYGHLMLARAGIGLGEAGYGGAGGAILAHVFPPERRSLAFGIMVAASLFGMVVGVMVGGYAGASHGWRSAFLLVGAPSLILVVLYPLIVRDYKTVALTTRDPAHQATARRMGVLEVIRELFAVRTTFFTWIAGGLTSLSLGAFIAWIPAFVGRSYGFGADRAALVASVALAVVGLSMIFGGAVADRIGRRDSGRRLYVLAVYALLHFVLLTSAFLMPAGPAQLALIVVGALFVGAHTGVLIAVTTDIVHPGLCATGIAVMVLVNNIIGLAPGPVIVGALSDAFGLQAAMATTPLACLVASGLFVLAARNYAPDRRRIELSSTGSAA
jgi:predicted MFS family arabinose efflux permease